MLVPSLEVPSRVPGLRPASKRGSPGRPGRPDWDFGDILAVVPFPPFLGRVPLLKFNS